MINSSIKFPVTVIVGVLIAVIGGFLALNRVPVQLTPEVERPIVNITTTWLGASPQEIEKEIIEKQEEYLKSVEGIIEMRSEATEGQASITLEFPAGTDLTGAVVKVTNKLNEVPEYPENSDRPIVTTSGQLEGAIAWFIVKSINPEENYIPHQKDLVEDLVKPRLERVEGVASVNVFGGFERELHVTFDPDLLASSGVSIGQLAAALRADNRDISAGDFGEGKRRYVVRTVSRFENIEQVEQTVVTVKNGIPIRVKDLAEVKLDYQKPFAMVRAKGEPAIAFNAQRQVGANVMKVLDGLMEQLAIINREVLEPQGMRSETVYRESVYIESSIDLVFSNIYLGGILAILTLFVFLRSYSAIFIIALAIPISIITTFLTMSLFGRTINVISLAGMAFAVGMVVDSAIVVLENIYRHMQMGKPRWKAAYEGTIEVWGALLASTVTTVAVFLPVMFVQEQAGQLFQDISIAICSAIAVSLIVSITVIPSLSSRMLKVSSKLSMDSRKSLLGRISTRIASFVDYINAKGARRLGTIAGIVVVSMGLTWVMLPDAEYLPTGNRNLIFAFMLPPPGYNLEEMVKAGQTIESQFRPFWEADEEKAKTMPGGGIDNFFFVALYDRAFFGMAARDDARARELVNVANGAIFSIPGNIGFASQASLFGGGFAGTRSVRIDITGPELPKILEIAGAVFGQVGQVLPGSNSRPIPGLDLGNPEVRVYPDRIRAADVNLNATDIGQAVNALVDGSVVSEYFYNGREIDLVVKGKENWARHTQDIAMLPLATQSGHMVTVGDVAQIKQEQGPVQINHVERQRVVSIETSLPDNIPLEQAMNRLQEQVIQPMRDQGMVSGLYDINLSGTADDLSKLRAELFTDFNLAVVLTYLLLAALFQSFTYPLVVMLTVPLATFGGVLGLNIVRLFDPGQQLDVLTMLGFVILVGTVINNSILIVYHALQLMRDGTDSRTAVKESVRVRVRPILMSTGTSVLGMMPLIIMPGAGSELYRGLGAVVVGGLAVSTVITLVLTPLVFSYAIEFMAKMHGLFNLKGTPLGEPVEGK